MFRFQEEMTVNIIMNLLALRGSTQYNIAGMQLKLYGWRITMHDAHTKEE